MLRNATFFAFGELLRMASEDRSVRLRACDPLSMPDAQRAPPVLPLQESQPVRGRLYRE